MLRSNGFINSNPPVDHNGSALFLPPLLRCRGSEEFTSGPEAQLAGGLGSASRPGQGTPKAGIHKPFGRGRARSGWHGRRLTNPSAGRSLGAGARWLQGGRRQRPRLSAQLVAWSSRQPQTSGRQKKAPWCWPVRNYLRRTELWESLQGGRGRNWRSRTGYISALLPHDPLVTAHVSYLPYSPSCPTPVSWLSVPPLGLPDLALKLTEWLVNLAIQITTNNCSV